MAVTAHKAFYFTYGSEGQPYKGGWTIVYAPDVEIACAMFRAVHPNTADGLLNCSTVYSSEEFTLTSMYRYGNLGARAHEQIKLSREVLSKEES